MAFGGTLGCGLSLEYGGRLEGHHTARVIEPPGRLLGPEELAALARRIAAKPSLWGPFVRHGANERGHEQIYLDSHVGVWVISWMPGHDTGLHDHEWSNGGVAVAEGAIVDERPRWGMPPRRVEANVGDSFCLTDTEIHRMVNLSDAPTVTIHAYSPPIDRMGLYAVDDDGSFRRRSLPWDETLDAGSAV